MEGVYTSFKDNSRFIKRGIESLVLSNQWCGGIVDAIFREIDHAETKLGAINAT